MADNLLKRRPRLAYPFTILTEPDRVRLVAGEDYRYTLTAPTLDSWLPQLLDRLTGKHTLAELLTPLTPAQRESAMQIVTHLYGERALVDGAAADAHEARNYAAVIEGQGQLYDLLSAGLSSTESNAAGRLLVYCQDRLDYEAAVGISRRCRSEKAALLWTSYGAMNRAYVSPLFLPDTGPCFGCLLRTFQRLSPAPEIYDALRGQARAQEPIAPVEFPPEGLLVLHGLCLWKLREAERADPDPGLYRLHVLEREHFEVTTHRVFVDPSCPECSD